VKSEKEKGIFHNEKEKAIAEKDEIYNELNDHKEKIENYKNNLKSQEEEIKN